MHKRCLPCERGRGCTESRDEPKGPSANGLLAKIFQPKLEHPEIRVKWRLRDSDTNKGKNLLSGHYLSLAPLTPLHQGTCHFPDGIQLYYLLLRQSVGWSLFLFISMLASSQSSSLKCVHGSHPQISDIPSFWKSTLVVWVYKARQENDLREHWQCQWNLSWNVVHSFTRSLQRWLNIQNMYRPRS